MNEFIIVDTEYTTWEGALKDNWSKGYQYRDMVQIGAIRVDENYKEIDSLDILIKPKMNPDLSDFFTQLTHITQEQVDEMGVSFTEALEGFKLFCGDKKIPVVYMGGDSTIFVENCFIHGLETPDFSNWKNIKAYRDLKGHPHISSGDMHKETDEPFQAGHTHNALHDVRSILAWTKWKIKTGEIKNIAEYPHDLDTMPILDKIKEKMILSQDN